MVETLFSWLIFAGLMVGCIYACYLIMKHGRHL